MLYGYVNDIDIKSKKYSVSGHCSLYDNHSLYILGGYKTKKDRDIRISRKESFKISMKNYDINDVELSLPSFYAMVDIGDYLIIHGGIYYKSENEEQKETISSALHAFTFENDEIVRANIIISSDNSPKGLYHHKAAQLTDNTIVFFGGISMSEKDYFHEKNNDSDDEDNNNDRHNNNNNHTYFLKLKYKEKSDNRYLKKLKWIEKECSTPQIAPCNRIGHTFVSHDSTQTCILYGGIDEDQNVLSDVYILAYDEENTYQWINPIFPKPSLRLPPLYGHCMKEYNDDCYIIYGGENSYNGETNNQIYIFTMLKYPVNVDDEMTFYVSVSKPLLSNALPTSSLYSSMTVHKGYVYIFGGNMDCEVMNNFYEYELTDKLMESEKPRDSSLVIFLKQLNLYYLLDIFLSYKIREKSDLDYISEEQYIEMGLKLGEYRKIMMNVGFIKKLDNCVIVDNKRIDVIVNNKNKIKEMKKDGELGDDESKIITLGCDIYGMKDFSILERVEEIKGIVGDKKVDLKGFKAYNCVVCQDNVSKYAFIPCGHYGACEDCCNLLREKEVFKCPVCNRKDPEIVEIRLPPNSNNDDE